MSDDDTFFAYNLPTGRRLNEESPHPQGYFGTVGPLRPYTPELGAALRRSIREIDDSDLEPRGKTFVDRTTGDEFTLVTTLVDPSSPGESQVSAFAVRENLVCYLRPPDAVEEVKVIGRGSFRGWRE
jgi:hypothetical protein